MQESENSTTSLAQTTSQTVDLEPLRAALKANNGEWEDEHSNLCLNLLNGSKCPILSGEYVRHTASFCNKNGWLKSYDDQENRLSNAKIFWIEINYIYDKLQDCADSYLKFASKKFLNPDFMPKTETDKLPFDFIDESLQIQHKLDLEELRQDLKQNGNVWEIRHSEMVCQFRLFSFVFSCTHDQGVLLEYVGDACRVLTITHILDSLEDLAYIYLPFANHIFENNINLKNDIIERGSRSELHISFIQKFYEKFSQSDLAMQYLREAVSIYKNWLGVDIKTNQNDPKRNIEEKYNPDEINAIRDQANAKKSIANELLKELYLDFQLEKDANSTEPNIAYTQASLEHLRLALKENNGVWEERHSDIALTMFDKSRSLAFLRYKNYNGILFKREHNHTVDYYTDEIIEFYSITIVLKNLTYMYLKFVNSMFDESEFIGNLTKKIMNNHTNPIFKNKKALKKSVINIFEMQNAHQRRLEIEDLIEDLTQYEALLSCVEIMTTIESD
jgi:hypothetical protein